MSNILELREKRAKAWDAAKAFLDSKRGGSGLLSAEDAAAYDRMEADVVALGKEIERLERQAAMDAELAKATSSPITNTPAGAPAEEKTGRASAGYTKAFWNAMRGRVSPEIQNALQTGVDTQGGFLVPEEFEARLIETAAERNIMRALGTVITTGGDRKLPVASGKGTSSWIEEEGEIPESDNSFGQVTLSAYKLATAIKVSDELLNDSVFDLESYIAKSLGERIAEKEDEAFIIGNGTGKPTGIFNATGGGQVGVTTASATAITLDEILDLFYSLKSAYRPNSAFLMNEATVKALRKLKDGNQQYLWQPSVKEGEPDKILGRPIHTSFFAPVAAAGNKTIAFGDFSFYWIADREGRSFKRLDELYARNGQVGFMAYQRVDGKLILPEAVKILQQKSS
ncbi:MAG: phage major capsid protein [Oscillospiraceae bacterium]|nr:phage major capsid protein [Oscillospiraceae bacterium]